MAILWRVAPKPKLGAPSFPRGNGHLMNLPPLPEKKGSAQSVSGSVGRLVDRPSGLSVRCLSRFDPRFETAQRRRWQCPIHKVASRGLSGQGYKGFGSFMVDESLGVMLSKIDEPGASGPELPFVSSASKDMPPQAIGPDLFSLDLSEFCFVNHGAFGASLRAGETRAQEWRSYAEKQPLRFFDRILFPHLAESVRRLANFLGLSNTDLRVGARLALTQNATAALDAVIASVMSHERSQRHRKSKIVMFDVAYGSVKKQARSHSETQEEVVELRVPFPLRGDGSEQLCAILNEYLEENADHVALGVLDHITSNTALVMPVKALVESFHQYGVPVLVDGAHGPNAVNVDITAMSCDFYVGNCHKWLCAPKAVGFLYVQNPDKWKSVLKPRVTSHGDKQAFPEPFFWDGCRDYAAALALPVVFDVWDSIGADNVRSKNRRLAAQAAAFLNDTWQTSHLQLAENTSPLCQAPMRLVALPLRLGKGSDRAFAIQQELYHVHRIECPVKAVGDTLHVRISAHCYNSLSHYEKLASAITKVHE